MRLFAVSFSSLAFFPADAVPIPAVLKVPDPVPAAHKVPFLHHPWISTRKKGGPWVSTQGFEPLQSPILGSRYYLCAICSRQAGGSYEKFDYIIYMFGYLQVCSGKKYSAGVPFCCPSPPATRAFTSCLVRPFVWSQGLGMHASVADVCVVGTCRSSVQCYAILIFDYPSY